MNDLGTLRAMLNKVRTTNYDDWALHDIYGDAKRTMSIGCPNGSGAGVTALFDEDGNLLSFKVYEADGYPCKCSYCAPFLSGSDNCGCDHSPCEHEAIKAPVQKVFVPTEFFSRKAAPKKGKKVTKKRDSYKSANDAWKKRLADAKKPTKKRSHK